MSALEASQLSVQLAGTAVLHSVSAQFAVGKWTAIVGPNGAGKSTLLKALAGLIPAQGLVAVHGVGLQQMPAKQRARTLAWLGQHNALGMDAMTVYDTVMLGRLPHQTWLAQPTVADENAVESAMQLAQVSKWRFRAVATLSGGQRQRVHLARALAVQASIVLLDEPLVNLDPPQQAHWVSALKAMAAQGVCVVTVLHDVNVALAADQLLVMSKGRVHHSGASTDASTQRALETVFEHSICVYQPLNAQPFAQLRINAL